METFIFKGHRLFPGELFVNIFIVYYPAGFVSSNRVVPYHYRHFYISLDGNWKLIAKTSFFFQRINGNCVVLQNKMPQFHWFFHAHTPVAEVPFIQKEKTFIRRIM